jgi:antitoxin component YwqK of YwqJK toxin-antitoxin module
MSGLYERYIKIPALRNHFTYLDDSKYGYAIEDYFEIFNFILSFKLTSQEYKFFFDVNNSDELLRMLLNFAETEKNEEIIELLIRFDYAMIVHKNFPEKILDWIRIDVYDYILKEKGVLHPKYNRDGPKIIAWKPSWVHEIVETKGNIFSFSREYDDNGLLPGYIQKWNHKGEMIFLAEKKNGKYDGEFYIKSDYVETKGFFIEGMPVDYFESKIGNTLNRGKLCDWDESKINIVDQKCKIGHWEYFNDDILFSEGNYILLDGKSVKDGIWENTSNKFENNVGSIKEIDIQKYDKGSLISREIYNNGILIKREKYVREPPYLSYHEVLSTEGILIEEYTKSIKGGYYVGKHRKYYQNGKLKSERNFDDKGRLNGLTIDMFVGGGIESRCEYHDNSIEGLLEEWYPPNGEIKKNETEYHDGEAKGKEITYYPSGRLHVKTFNDSKIPHEYLEYSDTGHLLKKGNKINGQFVGDYKEWYDTLDSHSLKIETHYNTKLNLDGLHKTYYSNGRLKSTGEYSNGKAIGVHIDMYDLPGNIVQRSITYENGVMSGLYQSFHQNGQLHIRCYYIDNFLIGRRLIWTPEGEILNNDITDDIISFNSLNR